MNNLFPIQINKNKNSKSMLVLGILGTFAFSILIIFFILQKSFSETMLMILFDLISIYLLYLSLFVFPKEITLDKNKILLKRVVGETSCDFNRSNIVEIIKKEINGKEIIIIKLKNLPIKSLKEIFFNENETQISLQEIYNFLSNEYLGKD
jgi:hypothetical protein